MREAADEIEKLRKERDEWVGKCRVAVWADSEELKHEAARAAAAIARAERAEAEVKRLQEYYIDVMTGRRLQRLSALLDEAREALRVAREALNNGGFISDKDRAAIDAVLKQGEYF